ncbi:hypothetical protein [Endozoicomonas sp. ALC066]|uniref:hypothetical protein n=1 Tax=Endozoicomonas sp. ALC066 TaxID=3403078 RepID=UPI003BB4920A
MSTYTVDGTYGRSKNPCEVFVYEQRNGSKWYAVEGSTNVNRTWDDIKDGVDVEELSDDDHFTAENSIESEEDLQREVDEL